MKNATHDDLISLAIIIDKECGFKDTGDVIYFFEKSWKWQSDIDELIKDYEQELLRKTQCKDCKYFDGGFYCDIDDNADDLEIDCTHKEIK
jgi:hypothetical protein